MWSSDGVASRLGALREGASSRLASASAAVAAAAARVAHAAGGTAAMPQDDAAAPADALSSPPPPFRGALALPLDAAFESLASTECVDLAALRALCRARGAPDGRRTDAWRLLLAVAPPQPARWAAELAARRATYARLVAELVVELPSAASAASQPSPATAAGNESPLPLPLPSLCDDHPLSLDAAGGSAWARHFAGASLRDQVSRDVERTQRDLSFFSSEQSGGPRRRKACERLLFVFASTNPGVRYVQGMNELGAPLFYLCCTSPPPPPPPRGCSAEAAAAATEAAEADAEADAFALFVAMLGQLRDLYVSALDGSASGVAGTLASLSRRVAAVDAELAEHLEKLGVKPAFYAFRWLSAALAQEMPLPDVLRCWDFALAHEGGLLAGLVDVCVALLLSSREQLLRSDFAGCVKLLQSGGLTACDGGCGGGGVDGVLRVAATLPPADERGGSGGGGGGGGGSEEAWAQRPDAEAAAADAAWAAAAEGGAEAEAAAARRDAEAAWLRAPRRRAPAAAAAGAAAAGASHRATTAARGEEEEEELPTRRASGLAPPNGSAQINGP